MLRGGLRRKMLLLRYQLREVRANRRLLVVSRHFQELDVFVMVSWFVVDSPSRCRMR
jgi:hypothetical protein